VSGLWTRLKGSSSESMRISWQTTAKMVGGARSTAAAHGQHVLSSSGVLGTVGSDAALPTMCQQVMSCSQ
jgi:hypothetical protein